MAALGTTPCPVCGHPLEIASSTPRQSEPGWVSVTLTFTPAGRAHLRSHFGRRGDGDGEPLPEPVAA